MQTQWGRRPDRSKPGPGGGSFLLQHREPFLERRVVSPIFDRLHDAGDLAFDIGECAQCGGALVVRITAQSAEFGIELLD
jgi:hypothetical protein